MSQLTGGKMLAFLNKTSPNLGSLFGNVIDAINHGFSQLGVDPVDQATAPPSPQSVNVTVTGELAHVRITDNNPTNRPRNYFTEIYADAQKTQLLHVEHHGVSRDATIALPTNASVGVAHTYYAQSYSQTPGSPPSPAVPFPTAITMGGSTVGTLPRSSGSGTAPTSGTVPAQGFGTYPTRKATGVKRSV